MQFKDLDISVLEQEGSVSAVIRRMGDIGHISSVICYTRQNTARVGEDFIERPNTEASRVVFQPGTSKLKPTVDERKYNFLRFIECEIQPNSIYKMQCVLEFIYIEQIGTSKFFSTYFC